MQIAAGKIWGGASYFLISNRGNLNLESGQKRQDAFFMSY